MPIPSDDSKAFRRPSTPEPDSGRLGLMGCCPLRDLASLRENVSYRTLTRTSRVAVRFPIVDSIDSQYSPGFSVESDSRSR